MKTAVALSPAFSKGLAVTISALLVFIGSVYVILAAYFGLRMGYLVLAVSFFGWMILLSVLWAFGAPGTPKNLGPRGTEPRWEVLAASTGPVESKFPNTARYPRGWKAPDSVSRPAVDTVRTAIQVYMAEQANEQLGVEAPAEQPAPPGEEAAEEEPFHFTPTQFVVENVRFSTAQDGTHLSSGEAYYSGGGPKVVVFTFHAKGNVPVYSWTFLVASILGFVVHVPLLDRAEKRRRAILTGGTAPPWYGPA